MKDPRSVLITGASSGIGEALALHYAQGGITLALTGRDEARLSAVAEAARARGATVLARPVDAGDKQAMAAFLNDADQAQALDLVIANAGLSMPQPAGSDPEVVFEETFRVNVAGVAHTIHPAIAAMRTRGRGQIALMASLAGFHGAPTAPAYCASKAAVKAYGEGLRGFLKPDGLAVTVICPGFVDSRITAKNKFPMPFKWTAPKAAAYIAKGLARNDPLVAFPWPLVAALRLAMPLPERLVQKMLGG